MKRFAVRAGLCALSFAAVGLGGLHCGSESTTPEGVDASSDSDAAEPDTGTSSRDSGSSVLDAGAADASRDAAGDSALESDASDAGFLDTGPSVVRVTKSPLGADANAITSNLPNLSADGRFVVFTSGATNLVSGDTNGRADPFVYDRRTDTLMRIAAAGGAQPNDHANTPYASGDGRFVAFTSSATNLLVGTTTSGTNAFLFDRVTGATSLVSRATAADANGESNVASISNDGQRVAFYSRASNLVPGDTNGTIDAFLYDVQKGISPLSVSSAGAFGDGATIDVVLSADGAIAAFDSFSTNLVAGDTNARQDVFVRDIAARTTVRVSVSPAGVEGDGVSGVPSLSSDGRFVAFLSVATNLVAGDTNGVADIFVRDLTAGTTRRVSLGIGGAQANDHSENPKLSADGRYVLFVSKASNLVPGDTNGVADLFRFDTLTNTTERVNVNATGLQGDKGVSYASLSGNGRFVAFTSDATNLVPNDTNGKSDVFWLRLP